MNRVVSMTLLLVGGTAMFGPTAWLPVASGQTKLPTVDDALKLSAATGRPVFAMAGRET